MPDPTFYAHLRKLRATRDQDAAATDPQPVPDLAESLDRRSLELVEREIARLERKQARGGFNNQDARTMRELMRSIHDARTRAAKRQALASSSNPSHRAAAGDVSAHKSVVLDRLARRQASESTTPNRA
jgi:hypothetical protein